MSMYVIDVEADSTSPATGSMVCFGAVLVKNLNKTFYGETKPIIETYNPEALAVSNITRDQHLLFDDPEDVMIKFNNWILETSVGKPIFVSDNLAFDWQWICYYFDKYVGKNPFGFSGKRIGDIYGGYVNNMYDSGKWKRFRKTKHDHNPVNDAIGNAEALHEMKRRGLNINF